MKNLYIAITLFIAVLLVGAIVSVSYSFAGENGAACRGKTCYIEGTGGDVNLWVIKSGADWSSGKQQVTRKGHQCDSACAVTAAILDGDGRLSAHPQAVYCFCHTDKARLAHMRTWPTISPQWRKLLGTGRPFRYSEVGH